MPGDFIHHVYATGMCIENSLGRVQRLRVPFWGVEWGLPLRWLTMRHFYAATQVDA